ncbi:hypothetical protein MKX67_12430 [Cytobacillus sp. FSL W7-1323]|uniref:hypothetical protein n=1 Tax=unclassified Cytobacillus TaxID=2675268 RepID=UPI002AFFA0DA|nr:hypothetical protein [Cytobacillus sp. OWB-43]MEA1852429.1 hypothetical protein [Cytobacillus sp. OWB-43]
MFLKEKITSNQDVYRKNYLSNLLEEQSQLNHKVSKQHRDLQHQLEETYEDLMSFAKDESIRHEKNIQQYNEDWTALQSAYQAQEQNQLEMNGYLQQIENKNEELLIQLRTSQSSYETLLAQSSIQETAILELSRKLDNLEKPTEKILEELTVITDDQATIKDKIETQDIYHQSVMEKLESQDALNEKLSRQIDHLKSIIFERTAYLTENFKSLISPVKSFFVHHEEKNKNK